MPKTFKKPDLNAPRYRPKKLNFTNGDYYAKFLSQHPKYASLSAAEFKEIISTFNGKIWNAVIDLRDGVELPEQLGYIFIGTCPRKKSNIDFKKSEHYGYVVQNQNWESDHFVAKIFYTNYETKYRFRHHDMWSFTGLRDFKRTLGQTYPTEWKKYVQVDNMVRISKIFRKQKFKQQKQIEELHMLDFYDEFNLETPWLET